MIDFDSNTVKRLHEMTGASLADCEQAIKRNPRHFGALSGYGQIYFGLEQFDKAIEYWRRALRVNPNMSGVRINIEGAEQRLREKGARTI